MPSIRDPEIPLTVPFTQHCCSAIRRRMMANIYVSPPERRHDGVEAFLNGADDRRSRDSAIPQSHMPTRGLGGIYEADEIDGNVAGFDLPPGKSTGFVAIDDIDRECSSRLRGSDLPDKPPPRSPGEISHGPAVRIRRCGVLQAA